MIKKIILATTALFLLNGCSGKYSQNGYERDIQLITAKDKNITLNSKINERKKGVSAVNIYSDKKLSRILDELSYKTNNIYILDKNSDDPIIKKNRHILFKNFTDICRNGYLSDVTNYDCDIEKNKKNFLKNKPKIIYTFDKNAKKDDLSKISIPEIKSQNSIKEFLNIIGKETGFNYIFIKKKKSLIQNNEDWLNNQKIYYHGGKSVQDLLIFLSKSMDVFMDIDYKNRLITFSKYKTKNIKLEVKNININANLKSSEIKSTASTKKEDISTKIEMEVYSELNEQAKEIIALSGAEEAYFSISNATGDISIKATPSLMKELTELVNNTNDSFNAKVEVILTAYEVILKRNNAFGIDFDINEIVSTPYSDGIKNTELTTAFNIASPLVIKAGAANSAIKFDSINKYGRIANKIKLKFKMRNNIPSTRDKITSQSYIKKSTTTIQQSTTNPIISENQEIGEVQDGIVVSILPMIIGNKVNMTVSIELTKILEMKREQSGNGYIVTPTIAKDGFNKNYQIKDGEKIILDSISIKQSSKNFKGLIPDSILEDFILGGNKGEDYIQSEMVFVAEVKIIK